MKRIRYRIAGFAALLACLAGCSQKPTTAFPNTEEESDFWVIEQAVAKSLDEREVLIDHDFTADEENHIVASFLVQSGVGQEVKADIERRLEESGDESLRNRSFDILVFEEADHDVVTWIYQEGE